MPSDTNENLPIPENFSHTGKTFLAELILAGEPVNTGRSFSKIDPPDSKSGPLQVPNSVSRSRQDSITTGAASQLTELERLNPYNQLSEKIVEGIAIDAEFSLPPHFFDKEWLDQCDISEPPVKEKLQPSNDPLHKRIGSPENLQE